LEAAFGRQCGLVGKVAWSHSLVAACNWGGSVSSLEMASEGHHPGGDAAAAGPILSTLWALSTRLGALLFKRSRGCCCLVCHEKLVQCTSVL